MLHSQKENEIYVKLRRFKEKSFKENTSCCPGENYTQMLTSEFCVFSLTEIVSGSVADQISSDSSNVVELIEVRAGKQDYIYTYFLSHINIYTYI